MIFNSHAWLPEGKFVMYARAYLSPTSWHPWVVTLFGGVGFIHKNWVIVAFGVCGYASEIYTRTWNKYRSNTLQQGFNCF